MTDILVVLFQILGAIFVFAAGVGLVRFPDPLQRMHASTKAGTLGAGFMVLAAMIELRTSEATLIGLAVIAFLLLTIPIAGHLLGRSVYVSGATLEGMEGRDDLKGVLPREETALDERLGGRDD